MRSRIAGAALLAAGLLMAQGAQAQSYVRADCQSVMGAAPSRYDTPEHERWYRRFWTGTCDHLPRCIPGSPNWNDVVGKLQIKGGPAERGAVLPKACRLGQLVGMEWARAKAIRKIDTTDLRAFNKMLDSSNDTLKGLDKVEIAARTKLGR